MIEQLSRAPGILGEDRGDGAQDLGGAVSEIAEVSNRGADYVEPAGSGVCSRNLLSRYAFGTAPTT